MSESISTPSFSIETQVSRTHTYTPSSPSSPAPSPTTSVGATTNSGTSPPLILGLLSIGLFACSMIGVIIWRRMHYTRRVLPSPRADGHLLFLPPTGRVGIMVWGGLGGTGNARAKPPREIGKRPKLWDLKTTVGCEGERSGVRGWDGIMPISVTITPVPELDTCRHAKRLTTTTMNTHTNVSHTAIIGTTQWSNVSILDRPASSGSDRDLGANVHELPSPPADRIQVAVAIAMPNRSGRTAKHRVSGGEGAHNPHDDDDDNGGINSIVYTLGLYERPWKCEEG